MKAIRQLAAQEQRRLSDVVNELLAEGLERRRRRSPATINLPSFSMGRPRVNLADRDALESEMET